LDGLTKGGKDSKFKDAINDLIEQKSKQAMREYRSQRTYDNIGSSNMEEKRWL
jgi:hypothetical protein